MNPKESDFNLEDVKVDKLSLNSSDSAFEFLENDSEEKNGKQIVSNLKIDENKKEIIKECPNLIIEERKKLLSKKEEEIFFGFIFFLLSVVCILFLSDVYKYYSTSGVCTNFCFKGLFKKFEIFSDLCKTNAIIGEKICYKPHNIYYSDGDHCCRLIRNFLCNLDYDVEKLEKCKNLFKFNKFFRSCFVVDDISDFLDLIYDRLR